MKLDEELSTTKEVTDRIYMLIDTLCSEHEYIGTRDALDKSISVQAATRSSALKVRIKALLARVALRPTVVVTRLNPPDAVTLDIVYTEE